MIKNLYPSFKGRCSQGFRLGKRRLLRSKDGKGFAKVMSVIKQTPHESCERTTSILRTTRITRQLIVIMKTLLSILSLLLSLAVVSQSRLLPFLDGGSRQKSLSEVGSSNGLQVPGDSPLRYCEDPTDDILQIDHVNLNPNPPKPYACHLVQIDI